MLVYRLRTINSIASEVHFEKICSSHSCSCRRICLVTCSPSSVHNLDCRIPLKGIHMPHPIPFRLFLKCVTCRVPLCCEQKTHGFTIAVSVICQEGLRVAMLWVYVRSEKHADAMVKPGGVKLFNDMAAAIALGEYVYYLFISSCFLYRHTHSCNSVQAWVTVPCTR